MTVAVVELAVCEPSSRLWVGGRPTTLERTQALDHFLAAVERRAFRAAHIATGDVDEAMDIVQDAMLKLVQRYGSRDESEWGPLFHTILQSRIRDWYRRAKVRNRWRQGLGRADDDDKQEDPLESIADANAPSAEDQLRTKRTSVALDEALRTLPLRQQQAFLLRHGRNSTWRRLLRRWGVQKAASRRTISEPFTRCERCWGTIGHESGTESRRRAVCVSGEAGADPSGR